jgi:hypothetical protein
VLLSYQEKACYFASPYVDSFGENHHEHLHRGNPLYLDQKRGSSLRKIMSLHRVARDVVQKRDNSQRLIIQGFY